MAKKFHITVSYDNKTLANWQSECAAIIGAENAATCCITNDIAVRVVLAARVKVYLNSLINTILSDTNNLSKEMLETVIDEVVSDIILEEKCVDPSKQSLEEFDQAIARMNKARREEGDGNG